MLIVQKFGGTSVMNVDRLRVAAQRAVDQKLQGNQVVVVVSAQGGTTDDLIGPAVFLASDASNFVNGHILYVDGGILAYIGKQP